MPGGNAEPMRWPDLGYSGLTRESRQAAGVPRLLHAVPNRTGGLQISPGGPRAAMIVMRTTPLARDAPLARIGAPPSARLPEPELDIQARDVVKLPASSTAEGLTLRRARGGHRVAVGCVLAAAATT
jgi:hypothetical protein